MENILKSHMSFPISQFTDQLISYTLHLADNNLIFTQRNAEWCGHGPILEQDIAITNITLDLIGQSRNFYQYAAKLLGGEITEDTLAYNRNERSFKNCLLAEQPNGDWAQTVLKQFFYSSFQYYLYEEMKHSADDQLAAIASKSLKEVTYHVTWSSEWVIRLGDGTAESHNRMQHAITELWPYTGELFMPADYETEMINKKIAPNAARIKDKWFQKIKEVFEEATLTVPENIFMHTGGKTGTHTEHLGYMLAELQYLQKTYPGAEW